MNSMSSQGVKRPKRKRKPESVIRKGSRDVFEIVKSHWPVTPAEIMQLKHYAGKAKTGHSRFLGNLKNLQVRADRAEAERTRLHCMAEGRGKAAG